MTQTYYKNVDSATIKYRALRGDYGLRNRSNTRVIGKVVKEFKETKVVTNIESSVHHRFARSAENIAIISKCRHFQELGLFLGTLWHILHLDAYQVQLMQQLKPADHSQCRRYMEWVLEQQAVDGNSSNKIFFSDKAHFTLGEYVNKQNFRIWGSKNPHVIV